MDCARRIIVNADDFGISEGVNAAIVRAHRAGSISSATMLANCGNATTAAAQLSRNEPALAVGLHFTLTSGAPLSVAMRCALPSPNFVSRVATARLIALRRITRESIRAELEDQFAHLVALGVKPSHIDSHQHVHLIPVVFRAMAEFCMDQGIPMRIPWRLGVPRGRVRAVRQMKEFATDLLNHHNARRWAKGLASNRGFGSVFDLGDVPAILSSDHYRLILQSASMFPFELMVHPSGPEAVNDGITRIGPVSAAEGAFLDTPGLRHLIRDMGFNLINYRDLN